MANLKYMYCTNIIKPILQQHTVNSDQILSNRYARQFNGKILEGGCKFPSRTSGACRILFKLCVLCYYLTDMRNDF